MDDNDEEFLEEKKEKKHNKNKELNSDSLEEVGKDYFLGDEDNAEHPDDDDINPDVPFNNGSDDTRWQL